MGVLREMINQVNKNEMDGVHDGAASWRDQKGVLLTTEEAKRLLDMITSDMKFVGVDEFMLPLWKECSFDSKSPISRLIKKFEPKEEPKRGQFRSDLFGVIIETWKCINNKM